MRFLDNPTGALRAVSIASGIIPDGPGRPTGPGGGDGPRTPGPGGGGFGPGGGGGGGGGGEECTWEKQKKLSDQIDTYCAAEAEKCKQKYPDGHLFDCGDNKVNADCTVTIGVPICTSTGKTEPKKTEVGPS